MNPGTENAEIHNLLFDLLTDLHSSNAVWQVGGLTASLIIAWWVTRLVQSRLVLASPAEPSATLKIGVGGLNRIVFPFSALICVVVARLILGRFQHEINLLNLAVPLLFSLMLVRVAVYVLRRAFRTDGALRYWERAIAWSIWLGVALYLTGLLPEVLELSKIA